MTDHTVLSSTSPVISSEAEKSPSSPVISSSSSVISSEAEKSTLLRQEVRENLISCILPFWLNLKDPDGGFYGEVTADGTVLKDAQRGVILNARIIWSFAAAYQAIPDKEYLLAAIHAKDWFLKHFCDHKYGGVYWSVNADGSRLDTKKQLYAQGFAIYGLSELYKVTHDDDVLKAAVNIYKVVESCFADREFGGYVEALARDFSPLEDMSLSAHDINADKTMNSHLHILEAYANLYTVWPDAGLKKAVESLLDIIGTKVMAASGHLQLYFGRDWSVLPGGVSFGHDIETSWLALECAFALGDPAFVERVRPWAYAMGLSGNEGLFPDGSMQYEDGDESRQWWVQAETVVGNIWLWKFHPAEVDGRVLPCRTPLSLRDVPPSRGWHDLAGQHPANPVISSINPVISSTSSVISNSSTVISSEVEKSPSSSVISSEAEKSKFLSNAIKAWEYIKNNLVDAAGGEWWWAILPDGSIDKENPKAGFWKCPYHNTRMCLQVMSQLSEIK